MNRNRKVVARAMAVAVATSVVGAYSYQTSGTVVMAEEETTEMLTQAASAVLEGNQASESEEGTVTAAGQESADGQATDQENAGGQVAGDARRGRHLQGRICLCEGGCRRQCKQHDGYGVA